jgi:hypothetical protein
MFTMRRLATRLPSLRYRRLRRLGGRGPVPHRFALPRRYTRRRPPTVLERRRWLEARRGGGPPPFARSVERGAERVADALRARLLALRGGLLALRQKLAAITRSRRRWGGQ